MQDTPRKRLTDALNGKYVDKPAYMVYDWFVMNRNIDWQSLFDLGLGQINHACLVEVEYPNLQIEKKITYENGQKRVDIYWKTDIGQLHEWFLDEWRQEYLIKTPQDYKIMAKALSDSKVKSTDAYFDKSESQIQDRGFTIGQFGNFGEQTFMRTPFQVIQIDYTGLERFSMDIAYEVPELLDLIEQMNHQLLEVFKSSVGLKCEYIKLWENLSIETMGPVLYRKYLIPVYRKIFDILNESNKKLIVHYDGKLKIISEDMKSLAFDGFDSITPPPEGDLAISEIRQMYPDRFLWIHPTLSWFDLPKEQLIKNILDVVKQAGNKRFCFQLSEEVPPNWQETLPAILRAIK
jgi:hypothetical protein